MDDKICCGSCLNWCEPWSKRKYEILYRGEKVHQEDEVTLCYVCSRIAKYAEKLITNLQNKPQKQEHGHDKTRTLISLSIQKLNSIELSGEDCIELDSTYTVVSLVNGCEETKCLKYCKEELNLNEHFEAQYVDADFGCPLIKQEDVSEDDFPLKTLLEDIYDKKPVKTKKHLKRSKVRKKWDKVKLEKEEYTVSNDDFRIPRVYITLEEYDQERIEKSTNEKYINAQFKCSDCVLGFSYKISYLKHMDKHSEHAGEFVCDLCKQHFQTKDNLEKHLNRHKIRYKCVHCGLLRHQSSTIRHHLYSVHKIGNTRVECMKCSKVYKSWSSLKKHIKVAHTPRERVPCMYCQKTYKSLETLKAHMILSHSNEVAPFKREKSHVCQECAGAFRSATSLRNHMLTHSESREYYCVECDKKFKSEYYLTRHLKTATPHITYSELPLPCTHCEKRFSIKRDLERHMNRIHLNIRPFQCDQCPRAYINSWSLNDHKKTTHEGYKRPLLFQCEFCDKAFARRQILKAHIRTHTGERPYQCTKCHASFSQSGVLNTHNKLVHLRLGRGKNKVN